MALTTMQDPAGVAGVGYADFYQFCIEINRHIYDEALKRGIETVSSRVTVLGDVAHPSFEVNIKMRKEA